MQNRMLAISILILCIISFLFIFKYSPSKEGDRVIVMVPPVRPVYMFGETLPAEVVSFPVVMVVDNETKTGYKIPKDIDDAKILFKIALGDHLYQEYVMNFDANYCVSGMPGGVEVDTRRMSNFFYFIGLSWDIEKNLNFRDKINYYKFNDVDKLMGSMFSIIGIINHGYEYVGDVYFYCSKFGKFD